MGEIIASRERIIGNSSKGKDGQKMEKWDIDELRCRMLGLESLIHSVWVTLNDVTPERESYDDYNEAMQGLYAIYQYLNDLNNESMRIQDEMVKSGLSVKP